MRPYIAILIDSFWEAVSNKVLWALLIGWSLLLLALAPFGYISERSFLLASHDIDRRSELVEKLTKAVKGRGDQSVNAVAEQLDEDFQQRLLQRENDENAREIRSSELAKELNVTLAASQLYSEEVFPTAERRKRIAPLLEIEPEQRTDADIQELNRYLLQLAFPLELSQPRSEQLWIGYGTFKIGSPLPITRRQISEFIEPIILSAIIKLGLGVLAVFVAIVVTSPIIPDTFRSGSLHLLLSKPISRVWLYLAKFFGGCIFVLVNISFVLIGLYFIAGLRFDIWNSGLLACIPLLMFVFVIFYSVSALVGLLWGNAIVCVVACMIFWAFCFGVGAVHDTMMQRMEVMSQISRVAEVDGEILSVSEEGAVQVWNDKFSVWQPAVEQASRGQMRTFGPIYDEQRQLVLVKSFLRLPFNNLRSRSNKLSLIRLSKSIGAVSEETKTDSPEEQSAESEKEEPDSTSNDHSQSSPENAAADDQAGPEQAEDVTAAELQEDIPKSTAEAREKPMWMADEGPELPSQLVELIELGDSVIAVCRDGPYLLDPKQLDVASRSQAKLFGWNVMAWSMLKAFKKVAPDDYYLSDNAYAAPVTDQQGLVVYSSGNVEHLVMTNGKFEVVSSAKLHDESEEDSAELTEDESEDGPDGTEAAIVQMNDAYCIVARDAMPLTILDRQLKNPSIVELPSQTKVRQLAWIPGSNDCAVITHTGEFLRVDCETSKLTPFDSPFDGKCSGMQWINGSQVWLGVKPNRACLWDVDSGEVLKECTPVATAWETAYRWFIKPIYRVNPKPTALDNAMNYVLSGNKTQALDIVTSDLEAAQLELDIWRPIASNFAFVVVMLGIGCFYVARKEF